jgi:hypothetical protein
MAVIRRGSGHIGTHPLAAGFAKRIDALHGETGQVLHFSPLRSRKAQLDSSTALSRSRKKKSEPLVGQIPRRALPGL